MTHLNIVRAWTDEKYRLSLSEAEQAQLPAHPAGLIALTEAQLGAAAGGGGFAAAVFAGVVGCFVYDLLKAAYDPEPNPPAEARGLDGAQGSHG